MRKSQAEYQRAYRERQAARIERLEKLARLVMDELGESNAPKGKRLYEAARAAMEDV